MTPERQADGTSKERAVLREDAYLDVTYSATIAPPSTYPEKLASFLCDGFLRREGRLLDMGCGRGDFLRAFAGQGLEVAGLDISARATELAEGFDVRVVDLETEPLPFESGTFDFVFSKSVVEHMRDPVHLISAAALALKPGGIAVVMTPSWVHNCWGPFYIDHTHVTPFTAPSLADLYAFAGFESVDVSHFHQLPFVWNSPLLKIVPRLISLLPLPYRPFQSAPWPNGLNKLIRFSKEVMLLGIGRKHKPAQQNGAPDL